MIIDDNVQWRTVGQRIGGGGAPSGKVCVVTSVANFLVWGGGKTPKCTDNKCTSSEASERLRNIYFQDSKYICLHNTINAFSFTYGMAL